MKRLTSLKPAAGSGPPVVRSAEDLRYGEDAARPEHRVEFAQRGAAVAHRAEHRARTARSDPPQCILTDTGSQRSNIRDAPSWGPFSSFSSISPWPSRATTSPLGLIAFANETVDLRAAIRIEGAYAGDEVGRAASRLGPTKAPTRGSRGGR